MTTSQRGVGDVIVTQENELLPRIKKGRPYELIFPAETVAVEKPIAVLERNADRHHMRDLANAFVAFLNAEEAQQAFVEFGFRPPNERVRKTSAAAFTHPPHLFTIADLGGWGLCLCNALQSSRRLGEGGGRSGTDIMTARM